MMVGTAVGRNIGWVVRADRAPISSLRGAGKSGRNRARAGQPRQRQRQRMRTACPMQFQPFVMMPPPSSDARTAIAMKAATAVSGVSGNWIAGGMTTATSMKAMPPAATALIQG